MSNVTARPDFITCCATMSLLWIQSLFTQHGILWGLPRTPINLHITLDKAFSIQTQGLEKLNFKGQRQVMFKD